MIKKIFFLSIVSSFAILSLNTQLFADSSFKNKLSRWVKKAEQLTVSQNIGVKDGDFYPSDIQAIKNQLANAKSISHKSSASDQDVNQTIQKLKKTVAYAREHRISHRKDLEIIYQGVSALVKKIDYVKESSRCTTTGVLVFKENGFTVFNSNAGMGPAAAGRIGDGKIFFTAAYLNCLFPATSPKGTYPGQEKMAHNTLKWLTQRSKLQYTKQGPPLKILQQNKISRSGLGGTLYNLNITTVHDILKEADRFDPEKYPVAIVKPTIDSAAVEAVLLKYVKNGGSLIMGWPVPRVDLRTYPGQRLLSQAGILWARKWSWIRGPIPSIDHLMMANVPRLLKTAKAVEADWSKRDHYGYIEKSVKYYDNILLFLNHEIFPKKLFPEFNKWLYDQYLALNITYPIKEVNKKPLTRLIVPAYHALWNIQPGQPPAPGADDYPGRVDSKAPRVTQSFSYNFNQQVFKKRLRVIYSIGHRISTGLYAAPGDDITITVSKGVPYKAVRKNPKVWVRIGAYGWNNATKNIWVRPPLISFSHELKLGKNVVNNPFGGLIYIWGQSKHYRNTKVNVQISGAVEAPYFVLGKHSNKDWASIRNKPAPWAEIQSKHMIQTLPSEQIREMDDVESIARLWDRLMQNTYDLSGLSARERLPHTAPNLPSRVVSEIQLSGGAAHAGYPIGVGMHHKMNTAKGIKYGSVYHEIAHNFHPTDFYCYDGSHPQADLFTLYQQDYFRQPSRVKKNNRYGQVKISLKAGKTWEQLSDPEQLVFYAQIRLAVGWEPFTKLYRYVRETPDQNRPAKNDKAAKCDLFLTKMSEFTGLDLRGHFAHYGILNGKKALDKVVEMNLPKPNPPLRTLKE